MPPIDASPPKMKQFAGELLHCSDALRKEEMLLFSDLAKLGQTWKDERFQHFDRLIGESTRELAKFHTSARRYADYLTAKARAGEKFLRG